MVDPCFTMWQCNTERDPFLIILAEKVVTDVHTVTPMLFHELFWNPTCTEFMEVKSVTEDSIHRTVTNLQLVFHFNSHPSVVNQHADLLNVPSTHLCVQVPWNMSRHSYTLHCSKTVTTLCWQSAMNLCTSDTFSPQKLNNSVLLSFGACHKWSSYVNNVSGRHYITSTTGRFCVTYPDTISKYVNFLNWHKCLKSSEFLMK